MRLAITCACIVTCFSGVTPKPDFTAKQSNRRNEFYRSDTTCIKVVIFLIQLFFHKQRFLIPLGLKNTWYLIFLDNDLCRCISVKVKKKKVMLAGLLAVPNLCRGRPIY